MCDSFNIFVLEKNSCSLILHFEGAFKVDNGAVFAVKKVDQNAIAVDEDGDLILDRCDELQERIIICHACSTGLNYVGLQVRHFILDVSHCKWQRNLPPLYRKETSSGQPFAALLVWHVQVWPGALLLADYILANEGLFNGCMGLEVGAGTGFAGLVLVRTARRVFLADHDPAVLRNCQTNVEANQHLFRQGPDVALVREMDLFHAMPSEPGPLKASREVGQARCLPLHPRLTCMLLLKPV